MGLLQSKCGYENEEVVDSIVNLFEKKNLPLDAIILDAFWFGGWNESSPENMGNFTWLQSNFPDPDAYLNRLHKDGIKTILINEPFINTASENYDFLEDKGYLVSKEGEEEAFVISPYWAGDASLLDISHPGAQEWLWQQLERLLSNGVDGLWTDLTEPEYTIENGEFFMGPEEKVHNIYSNLFAEAIYEGWRKDLKDKRVFNLTRAGFAGIHRYGAVSWSGDASKTWIALKLQVPMLIGCAMSGLPHFSSDVGGFTNAHDRTDGLTIFSNFNGNGVLTTPELYTRWFQFGVFSPGLRPHSGENQFCEPFAFEGEAERISSHYLKWRYRLLSYLYSYAFKTSTLGEQLIKPLFMSFDDENCFGKDYQYMFGNQMMIAPVLEEGKRNQEVYFPKLEKKFKWISFWNDKMYEPGQTEQVPADLSTIPVFVPQPSVIPLSKVKKYIGETPDDTLTWRIYPGGKADFTLYEDDGMTYGYENGEFATTTIFADVKDNDLNVIVNGAKGGYEGMLDERTWVFDIRLIRNFNAVYVNGEEIKNYEFDKSQGMLRVKVNSKVKQNVEVTIKNVELNG